MAWALHKSPRVVGQVRLSQPGNGRLSQNLWLVPHYPPGVRPIDVRVRAYAMHRGSCLSVEAFCRDFSQAHEGGEYRGAVAIQDDWRVQVWTVPSHVQANRRQCADCAPLSVGRR